MYERELRLVVRRFLLCGCDLKTENAGFAALYIAVYSE